MVVVSDILPGDGSAGGAVLEHHLHLLHKGFSVKLFRPQGRHFTLHGGLRRMAGLACRAGARRAAEFIHVLQDGRWASGQLETELAELRTPAILLTVAHGTLCYAALRAGRRFRIPVVAIFHDWWPDVAGLTSGALRYADLRFRALAKEATATIAVSEGMREELGGARPGMEVIAPIPLHRSGATRWPARPGRPIKVAYCGNLNEYGAMVERFMRATLARSDIRFEVRGAPKWSALFRKEVITRGNLLPIVSRTELDDWLKTADVFLVPMIFDSRAARRMRTSFPSKVSEFAYYGKPLIFWAPNYSSLHKWAERADVGLRVSDPNPEAPLQACLDLARDDDLYRSQSTSSARAYARELAPEKIQSQFEKCLAVALQRAL